MNTEIPTEFHIAWLDWTLPIHWNYHAWLMVLCWFVLVPFGVMSIRYFKNKPTPRGLPRGVGKFDRLFIWWIMHIWTLYTAIALSLLGAAVALVTSGRFSGSLHAWFGALTIIFGTLQIIVAWQRGSHGGHNHLSSDPADPSTWRGDHFDMTPRRRWFEAYHKPGGYLALFLATGAVATGLMQFWMPLIAVALPLLFLGIFALVVVLEGRGYRHDTYRAVFGTDPDLPGNKMRAGE
ncbi:MAG: hypothetical protein KDK01_14420 [Rhodobacteraceae bacterium]|jgi:hypothetical protein|nr:hypothetical protein [Paracoccaceae bacterium]